MGTLHIAALIGLLAVTVTDVSAIYCFQCNSYMDKECEYITSNDTSSSFYKECEQTEENAGQKLFCRKTEQLILDVDFEHTRIIRSCAWVRHKYDCYDFKNKGHEEVSCTCYEDGCNSAPSSSFPSVLPLIAILSLLAILKSALK